MRSRSAPLIEPIPLAEVVLEGDLEQHQEEELKGEEGGQEEPVPVVAVPVNNVNNADLDDSGD